MTKEYKEKLKHRFLSFLWRLAGFILVAFVGFIADNLGLFGFSPEVTILLGLILGEITKFYNVNLPELKKAENV